VVVCAGQADSLAFGRLFALLQAGRLWVLATLGERWTTRIIILPGAPLVASGPFRFVQPPNYLIVVAEIAVLPLASGCGRSRLSSACSTPGCWRSAFARRTGRWPPLHRVRKLFI
jgi:hypothetical protein